MQTCRRLIQRPMLPFVGVVFAILVSGMFRGVSADELPGVRQRFVPADRPDLWPIGGNDWVPLRRTDFDRLVKRVRSLTGNGRTIPFNTAVYEATFDSGTLSLSGGTATLEVSPEQPPGSLIPCSPLNLSIDNPRWLNSDIPAVLGAAAGGGHFLAVPASARKLQFDWQLTGIRRLSGAEFSIRVPTAVASTLSLTIPRDWTLTTSSGTVTRDRSNAERTGWRLDLGRRTEARLRVIEPGQSNASQKIGLTTASLNSRFELAPLVVESATEVSFESLPPGERSLEFQIEEDWQIRSVERVSGGAVLWQDLGLANGRRQLRIEIPDGATAAERGFVVNSSLPIRAGNEVQLAPPQLVDAVLFDGRLQVAMSPPFTLQEYSTVGLSQTDVSAESGDSGRTLLSFQQFAPEASVRLSLRDDVSSRNRLLTVREFSVCRFDVDPPEFHADLQITSRSREVFSLDTWIPTGWEVTRITRREATGLQAELPWQTVQSSPNSPDLVRIRLPDGLETGRPAVLEISAQHVTWSRGSAIALPAVFPEIKGLTSVTTGLLFRPDDADEITSVDGFDFVERDVALSRVSWSTLAADLSGQPVQVHTTDYWENAGTLASLNVRRQGSLKQGALNSSDLKRAESANAADSRESSEPSAADSRNDASTGRSDSSTESDAARAGSASAASRPVVLSHLESFIAPGPGGRDLHRMSWRFADSAPERSLELKLPGDAVLLETLWNDEPLAASPEGDHWTIPVPRVSAGDTLAVGYTLRSKDIYLRDTRRVELPSFDAVNASFEWVLHLRKGYAAVSLSEEMTRLDAGRPAGWLRWFFGPLARSSSTDWFNPFSGESWNALLQAGSAVAGREERSTESEALPDDGQPSPRNWTTVRSVSGVVPRTLSVHLCRIDRLHALGWFVLVATCLVGVVLRTFQFGSRNRIGLIWLSGCLAAAVVVPDRYAELIGAAILGTVIATLLPRSLIRPQSRTDNDVSYPTMASTIALPRAQASELLRLLLVSGVLLGAVRAAAQNNEPALPGVIEVLVPYQGDRFDRAAKPPAIVYLDATVLRQLQQAAGKVTKAPSVLLTGTEWDAIVDRNDRSSVRGRLLIAVSSASGSVIEVPVPASLIDPETPVLLDGRPVSALPGFDGGSLLIPNPNSTLTTGGSENRAVISVAESRETPSPAISTEASTAAESATAQTGAAAKAGNPRPAAPSLPERSTEEKSGSSIGSPPGNDGRTGATATSEQISIGPDPDSWRLHTLELRLRPEIRIDGELRRFELPVSPVARSLFRLKFEAPPASTYDSSTGAPVGTIADGTIVLRPGPVSDIALDWSSESVRSASVSVRATVRSAAEIYPGRVLRQTLARCVPDEGSSMGRLAWKLPPHVQLDRQQIQAARLVDVVIQKLPDHTLAVLEFDPPHTEPFTIQMNWQQIAAASSGAAAIQWEVPVPPANVPLRVTVESHLAGVKAAPGFKLASELLQALEQSRVSTDSFLETWPENSRPRSPQIAIRIPERSPPDVSAQIVPIQPLRAVRQNLEARMSPSRIRWSVSAEIEISNAPAFLHELTIPENVRIDSVSLQQDEVDRLSHWERRGGRLVLFLKDRSTGIQTVTIEGRQEFDRQQPVPVPAVSVAGAQLLASTLQVYCQPGFRPVVSGAEPVDSLAESRLPAASGYVGEYRLTTGNEVSIDLQAVTEQHPLRWLAILDLLDDDSLQVELAIAVSAREPGEWVITLPEWTTDGVEILSIDGMRNVSSSESLSATIEDQTLRLSVYAPMPDNSEIRLRLPVDPSLRDGIADEQSVILTPPACDRDQQVPAAIVSREGSTQLKITGQLISDQQRQQLDSLLDDTLKDWVILKWESSSEVSIEARNASVLPAIVLHSVRCGGRMTQICRTRVLTSSDVRQLRVRWPDSITEIYRRIDGQLQPTDAIDPGDSNAETQDARVEVIDLPDSDAVHHLEFLWKPASTSDQIRIRRDTLDFPRITTDAEVEQFVEVIPAADVKVLPDAEPGQNETDRDALLARLAPWRDYVASLTVPPPFHVSRTLAAISRAARADSSSRGGPEAVRQDGHAEATGASTVSDSLSDQRFALTEENSQLLQTSSDGEVGVWMVDQRIDHILLGLVVGLAVVLPILKFFSFEFGERLAARPMLSFALLGLVWWSCLQSSAAGFGVLLVALLLWAAQSMIRRAKSRPAARLAVR